MPSKYIRNLSWNPQGQYYDVEKIEFGTTYTEGSGFSPDGSIGDSTALYSYDGDKTVTTLAKYVTRIPWTGEKGVVSVKAISYYESLTFNEATGELIAYDPSRTLVFQHYQNPDSSFQVETGRSIVWPAGYSVNHSANVDNEVTVFADKEAEYFDFELSTGGTSIDNEYSYKIRDKYDSSNRVDLAKEYGVSGNFDLGWWDYISFESQAIASTTEGVDEITGTPGNDNIYSLGGDDLIDGGDGEDYINGGAGNDTLIGGKWAFKDVIYGGVGDDFIGGGGGPGMLYGENGNDEIRAGHGKDILSGGDGADILYGGGGGNTFESELDGSVDHLFIMSDFRGHGYDWGRNHGGINADVIKELDTNDRISILGTSQSELSFRDVAANTYNQAQAGIGIFDGEMLEALYVGSNLSAGQLAAITTADSSRFW